MAAYNAFQQGNADPRFVVNAARITDRLDVKNCLLSSGRQERVWREHEHSVLQLQDMLEERQFAADEVVTKDFPDPVSVLVVRYEGVAEAGEEINPSDSSYARLYPVKANDIVISNIAASHGSIAVVPNDLDGAVVSSEYTILKPKDGFDSTVLQIILRSPEIRSDILLSSSGANRTRTRWDLIRDLSAPYPPRETVEQITAPLS